MDDIAEPETLNLPLSWLLPIFPKTITSWRKNFTKLTLVLILPALCFIFLAEIQASNGLVSIVRSHRMVALRPLFAEVQEHLSLLDRDRHHQDSVLFFLLGLFRSMCYLPFVVLSPLPVMAAVYYVAGTTTHQEFTFKKVMDVSFNVWKRLLTFSYGGYVAVLALATVIVVVLTCLAQVLASLALASFLEMLYRAGLVYLCLIWQMTAVDAVLDEAYTSSTTSDNGTTKQLKCCDIVEGKMWAKGTVLFSMVFLRVAVKMVFGLNGIESVISRLVSVSLFGLYALVIQMATRYFSTLYHLDNLQGWCSLLDDQDQREIITSCQQEGVLIKVVDLQNQELGA